MFDFNSENKDIISSKKKITVILLIIIALILVCSNIYFFKKHKETTVYNSNSTGEKKIFSTNKKDLDKAYQLAISQFDSLGYNLDTTHSTPKNREFELDSLRQKISNILSKDFISDEEKSEATLLIKALNQKIKELESEIDVLQKQYSNIKANNEVALAKTPKVKIDKKINTPTHYPVVMPIKVSNIRLEALEIKKKTGRIEKASKLRKADILQVIFDIEENECVKTGLNTFYIRIVDPEHQLLVHEDEDNTPTFKTNKNQMIPYTMQYKIKVSGQKMYDIAINWEESQQYIKGTYIVEIYHNGDQVGGGNVRLR